jgi:CxxC motif-containing protein
MTRQTHAILCICCPTGCAAQVIVEDGRVIEQCGLTCEIGEAYAAEEVVAPKRMVTTTVRVTGGSLHLLPVVSERPVPKEAVRDCVRLLRGVEVAAPIETGRVIVDDALGLGVAFRATRAISAAQSPAPPHPYP